MQVMWTEEDPTIKMFFEYLLMRYSVTPAQPLTTEERNDLHKVYAEFCQMSNQNWISSRSFTKELKKEGLTYETVYVKETREVKRNWRINMDILQRLGKKSEEMYKSFYFTAGDKEFEIKIHLREVK